MNDRTELSEREAALQALDTAYADFLDAFEAVPDEALGFVPAGEEYALGILPEHLCDPLWSYSSQLDAMLRCGFEPLDLTSDRARDAAGAQRHAQLAAWRPIASDREAMLARLRAAHQHAHSRLAAVDERDFTRTAPIVYSAGGAALPTSPRDIAGWLQAHFEDHTAQTRALLAQWRATAEP